MSRQYWIGTILVVLWDVNWAAQVSSQDFVSAGPEKLLLENLESTEVAVRRGAAIAISTADRNVMRRALPSMIQLLNSEKDSQVRLAVLDAMTALGPDAQSSVEALVNTFHNKYGDNQTEKRHQDYRAAFALGAIGQSAVPGLISLLDEERESTRAQAAMALGNIGSDAAPAIQALVMCLADEKERVRHEASTALGKIGQSAVNALLEASTHQDVLIREGAVVALGIQKHADDRIRDAVMHSLEDSSTAVQAAALKSLSALAISEDQVQDLLSQLLRSHDEGVRVAVVNFMVDRPNLIRKMQTELALLLKSEQGGVSRHAAYLVQRLGIDAAPILLDGLRGEQLNAPVIYDALAHLGKPIVSMLLQAMNDPDPQVQCGAALALGKVLPTSQEAIDQLTSGLNHQDRSVLAACLQAIGSLGPRARASIPRIRDQLQHESSEIRLLAIDTLFQTAPRDSQIVDDFISVLNDPSPQVQQHAIEKIRHLGSMGRRALPHVIEHLKSHDSQVSLAAAEMIGSHGRSASEAVPNLIELLAQPSLELQPTIARILGQLGEAAQPALPALIELFGSENVKIRSAVAAAIGGLELTPEAARPHLALAATDHESEVRQAAIGGMQRFGRRGSIFLPDLILIAQHESEQTLVNDAIKRFERSGPDSRSIAELISLLKHKSSSVRLLAVKFLGIAGQSATEALPELQVLTEDPDEAIRQQVEKAIEQIKNNPPPSRRAGS